ncbi:MAG TPA: citrate/2-methylcitrate synthase [Actinomycetota bacterium]
MTAPDARSGERGLRGVVAAETRISDVDGAAGKLWYAGYPIQELAERSTFEEVLFLLHNGRLPIGQELESLQEEMVAGRAAAEFVSQLMPTLAEHSSPMSMLRTCVSAASAHDPDGWDRAPEANHRKAMRLVALMPTLITVYDRHRRELAPVSADPRLPHAANFLSMLDGQEPAQEAARAFDVLFILYADHTMNASTFAARIVASTLADMHSAMVAAIAALKGPLHGGANEGAMRMLDEIGDPTRAAPYVKDLFARKQKVMGFGHPVYRTWDPRATIFRELAGDLARRSGDTRWFEISEAVLDAVLAERELYPNVDFYAASALRSLGVPTDLFTPVFAAARSAGWTAHVREQYANNRVIRPESVYVGPRDLHYVAIEDREAIAS